MQTQDIDIKEAYEKWRSQRYAAGYRGIAFELTFEEWLDIWVSSGHYHERGRYGHQYVMSRYGDVGPYSRDNVFIQTGLDNNIDGHQGKKYRPRTEEQRQYLSQIRKGKPSGRKMSEENKQKLYAAHKGSKRSEETKRKISEARKGIKQSEETKQKKRDAMLKRKLKNEE